MSSNPPQQSAQKTNAQTQSGLFRLPPELGLRIWEFALAGDIDLPYNAIWISSVGGCRPPPDKKIPPRCQTSLLLTCRQVFRETEPLPYKVNAIVGEQYDLSCFLDEVSVARLSHVRAITFSTKGSEFSLFRMLRLLPKLKILHLIIPRDDVARWAGVRRSGPEHRSLKRLRGLQDFRMYIQGSQPVRSKPGKRPVGFSMPEVLSDEDAIHVHPWWKGMDCMDDQGASTRELPSNALRRVAEDIAATVTQPPALSAASL